MPKRATCPTARSAGPAAPNPPTSGSYPFGAQAGQRADSFGLMDYQARYYDPRLGRFVSADTLVPAYTNPQDLNRYSYALNNSLKYADPSGHCVWDLCIVEGAIIGAGLLLAVDYGVQVNQNLKGGMSFWDAVYYENVDMQELGGVMLVGVGGGATTAVAAPAAAPYAYYYADKVYRFGQTPGGKVVGNALEGAAGGCLQAGCSPESVVSGAVEGAVLGGIEAANVRFAKRGISRKFRYGEFAGMTIDEVTEGLKSGGVSPDQLPIKVVERDGVFYVINNRSLMTLRMADLEPTIIENVTGNSFYERQITERLGEIGGEVGPDFIPRIR